MSRKCNVSINLDAVAAIAALQVVLPAESSAIPHCPFVALVDQVIEARRCSGNVVVSAPDALRNGSERNS